MAETTVRQLSIEVNANTTKATKAIDELIAKIEGLVKGKFVSGSGGIAQTAKEMEKVSKTAKTVSDELAKIPDGIKKVGDATSQTRSETDKLIKTRKKANKASEDSSKKELKHQTAINNALLRAQKYQTFLDKTTGDAKGLGLKGGSMPALFRAKDSVGGLIDSLKKGKIPLEEFNEKFSKTAEHAYKSVVSTKKRIDATNKANKEQVKAEKERARVEDENEKRSQREYVNRWKASIKAIEDRNKAQAKEKLASAKAEAENEKQSQKEYINRWKASIKAIEERNKAQAKAIEDAKRASVSAQNGRISTNNTVNSAMKYSSGLQGTLADAKTVGITNGANVDKLKETIATIEELRTKLKKGEITLRDFKEKMSELKGESDKANKCLKEQTKELEAQQKELDKASKKTEKTAGSFSKLLKSIGRIAFYRAVRFAIKEVTDALKEGVGNAYEWSKANGNVFSSSMDSMATSFLYLKNSIGASLMPILNALAPVIEVLANKFVNFINVINQFFAKLTGQSTWTRAIRKQKEYKESADKTAKSMSAILMGFDEINNITSPSSGSSDNSEDYDGMFEEVSQFDPKLTKLFNTLTKIKTSVTGLFETIRPKIREIYNLLVQLASLVNDRFGRTAIGLLKNQWEGAFKVFDASLDILKGSLEIVIGILSGDVSKVLCGILDIAGGVLKGLIGILQSTVSVILGIVKTVIGAIVDAFAWLVRIHLEGLASIFEAIGRITGAEWATKWAEDIRSAGESTKNWSSGVDKFFGNAQNKVSEWSNKACDGIDKVTERSKKFVTAMGDAGSKAGNNFAESFKKTLTTKTFNVDSVVQSKVVNGKAIQTITLSAMAQGGYASQGSMFLAGEVPGQAEMVGNINGRTGVASGKEITGIADAVYSTGDTNSRLLRDIYNALLNKNLTISPSANLGRVINQSNKMYQSVTGY